MSNIPDNSTTEAQPASNNDSGFELFYGAFADAADTVVGLQPPDKRRHIAVVGPSGSGKTTWACQADNCLVVLPESQGKGRVQDANPRARVICLADINRKVAKETGASVSMANTLRSVLKWLMVEVYAQNDDGTFVNAKVEDGVQVWPPPVLVLDGGTEACRILAAELGTPGKNDFGNWYTTIDERCINLIRAFRDLPCTFICTWLNDPDLVDGLNTQRLKTPWKKTAGPVSTLFDMVFWAFVQEKEDVEGKRGGSIDNPVPYTAYGIKTTGGEFGGYQLEHGKGHASLGQWIDPATTTPSDVLKTIDEHVRQKAAEAGLAAESTKGGAKAAPKKKAARTPRKKAPARKKAAPKKES